MLAAMGHAFLSVLEITAFLHVTLNFMMYSGSCRDAFGVNACSDAPVPTQWSCMNEQRGSILICSAKVSLNMSLVLFTYSLIRSFLREIRTDH